MYKFKYTNKELYTHTYTHVHVCMCPHKRRWRSSNIMPCLNTTALAFWMLGPVCLILIGTTMTISPHSIMELATRDNNTHSIIYMKIIKGKNSEQIYNWINMESSSKVSNFYHNEKKTKRHIYGYIRTSLI